MKTEKTNWKSRLKKYKQRNREITLPMLKNIMKNDD